MRNISSSDEDYQSASALANALGRHRSGTGYMAPCPADVKDVIVLADGDKAGEKGAQDCLRRWTNEGRSVRVERAPHGLDFNDLLRQGALTTEEIAQ